MPLVGNTYIQASSSDPGAVGFGYLWAQTDTGLLKARNTTNTAWVTSANLNSVNFGHVPLAGGALTGAISGATGLMPTSASTPFTAVPSVQTGDSLDPLVTQSQLQTSIDDAFGDISSSIQAAVDATPSLSVNDSIKWGMGMSAVTYGPDDPANLTDASCWPIPLPDFSDRPATLAECIFSVWPAYQYTGSAILEYRLYLYRSPLMNNKFCCWSRDNSGGGGTSFGGRFGYSVIAIKSTA